ncbi:MAG TPA: Ig-like domain-containing protein [Candidatus Binatia bacterium]
MTNPRRVFSPVAVTAVLSLAVCGAWRAPDALAQTTAQRSVEAVVVTGAKLPTWSRLPATVTCMPYPSGTTGGRDAHNGILLVPPDLRTGVPVEQIAAYRWNGTQFVEIPVQVDQMYPYCLSNPASSFAIYSGTDRELTYAWDVEAWKKTDGVCTSAYPPGAAPMADPVPTLDDDDEIVFLARDAGAQAPDGTPAPAGTTGDSQAIAITDPLNPSNVTFVYLFRKPGGSSFTATNGYVAYARDPDADQWIDRFSFNESDPEKLGTSNTGYGPNLTGTVCDPPLDAPRLSTDRFVRDGVTVSTDAYEWHASGRWMVRSLRIAKPGQPGVYGPDLIDRWKGRAFQQSPDSTISLVGFEDEQVNWEANAALLGERVGPVRAIREVWGADSGTNVTKTELFYPDAIAYHYHVRVHPIPPDGLYTSWDYNAGIAAKYYNTIKPDGVDIDGVNDDVGNIDGVFGTPAYFDIPDPTFNVPSAILNWEQVSGRDDFGSLVYIVELKGATTLLNPAVLPYYRDDKCLDDGTGDDPVSRPWPGEASTDQRVKDGYSAENGGVPYDQLACEQRQGAWGAHGIHYFVTGDTDNAASPGTLTEIDAQQWQFTVPTSAPTNLGDPYGNVVKVPLQTVAIGLGGLPFGVPPVASDANVSTPHATAASVTVSALDLDSCELAFAIVTSPAHGTLGTLGAAACGVGTPNRDSATVVYTPASDFGGSDTFTYRANDGTSDSNTATVTIAVAAAATPTPTATAGGATATPAVTATPVPTVAGTPGPPCGPTTLCGSQPTSGCKHQTIAPQGLLAMKNSVNDQADRLLWKWQRGEATAKAEFGDPLHTTDYELCVYDGNGTLVTRACAPAAGDCGGKPCWKDKGSGFTFRRRDLTGSGLKNSLQVVLKSGPQGKAKLAVTGKGGSPHIPPLPLQMPVRAQLVNGGGVCWEAAYGTPALRNDAQQFKDKGN